MKEIRVLHIGLSSNMGGIENVVKTWNDYLPNNIHFDFINTEDKPLAFQEQFEKKGARIYNIPSRKNNYIKSFIELKKIIENNEYDYIHHHMMSYSWPEPLIIAQRTKGCKAIAHSHTAGSKGLSNKYKIMNFIGKKILNIKEYYKLACGVAAGKDMFGTEKFILINNGVNFLDLKYSQKARMEIREQYKIADDEFVIGHVGRNDPVKNYPFLINLFSEVLRIIPKAKLLLIGDINENNNLLNILKINGITNHTILIGKTKKMKEMYSAMDLFILPSFYEGISVSLLEAQASGLYCLVSNHVAIGSDISNKVYFISLDNQDEWLQKINEIREKENNRLNLNLNIEFDSEKTSKKIFSFYLNNRIYCD